MELKVDNPKALTSNDVLVTRALYYRYGNWLLGYITEVVKDYKLAEEYLVEVFNEVPYRLDEFTNIDNNCWLHLQQLAKSKLSAYTRSLRIKENPADLRVIERMRLDRFVSTMTTEEQLVFCGIYYYQKSTVMLAEELDKPESEVRKILRGAFKIIRNG